LPKCQRPEPLVGVSEPLRGLMAEVEREAAGGQHEADGSRGRVGAVGAG